MEDILFEVLVWEQIEGCSGKFMSAPVFAAIARDTLVEAGVVQYTPSVSTIKLSGSTYSSQNIRQMSDKFESQHSLSPTIWSDI